MPEKRYTKVEEEIIQILDRLEKEEPTPSRPQLRVVSSRPVRQRASRFRLRRPRFDTRPAWFWLAASLGLAFVAYLVRDVSGTLTLLLAIASICAFFAPLFSRGPSAGIPSSGPTTKTWRGKDITFEPSSGHATSDRIRRWVDSRRRGPRRFK